MEISLPEYYFYEIKVHISIKKRHILHNAIIKQLLVFSGPPDKNNAQIFTCFNSSNYFGFD